MEDHEEHVLVGGEVHEGGAQQDVAGERERPADESTEQLVGARLRLRTRQRA